MPDVELDTLGAPIATALTSYGASFPEEAGAVIEAMGGALAASLVDLDDVVTVSTTTADALDAWHGKVVRFTNAAGCTLTVRANATIPLQANWTIEIIGVLGAVVVTSVAGVTINGVDAETGTVAERPGAAQLLRAAINDFDLVGDVAF